MVPDGEDLVGAVKGWAVLVFVLAQPSAPPHPHPRVLLLPLLTK